MQRPLRRTKWGTVIHAQGKYNNEIELVAHHKGGQEAAEWAYWLRSDLPSRFLTSSAFFLYGPVGAMLSYTARSSGAKASANDLRTCLEKMKNSRGEGGVLVR